MKPSSKGARIRIAFSFALLTLIGLVSPRALAQWNDPELSFSASTRSAEVGESITVQLSAMVDDGAPAPTDPTLTVPGGFSVQGPQITTQRTMQWINGRSSSKSGISATWMITPSRVGKFSLPSPTILWNGTRLRTSALQIEVVAAGTRPRRPSRSGSLFPGGPGFQMWPFGASQPADEEDDLGGPGELASDVRSLAMKTAPDPQVFLRAVADKTSAVIGEQITLSFYLYQRTSLEMTERQEAALSDFSRVPLLKNPGTEPAVTAIAGGERYLVRTMDRVAIFPLRTGDLHTGELTVRFGHRGRTARLERKSEDLVIRVTEPPKDGRPAGYAMGDVGQFAISASVQPRQIDQGGAVAVTLKVTGKGNLPESLTVPARRGIEWLDPEKKELIEPSGDVVGGFRSFGYVVRVKESGAVDLGKVDLPYWDPAANRYQVASATLGSIAVTSVAPTPAQVAAAAASPSAADDALAADPLANLPGVRRELRPYAPPSGSLIDGNGLWLLLAAPPLLFGFVSAGSRAGREIRERREAKKGSSASLAESALRDAAAAEKSGDSGALANAIERALHASIEAATGLKSRGVLLDDLAADLAARGVDEAVAERAVATLRACDSLRFDPDAGAEALGDLGKQGRGVARDLARTKAA